MLLTELITGLATKLAGIGMAAKAGVGLSVAAASVTGAAAAGVLPEAAQHAVATVVGSATPFTFPDSANVHATSGANLSADSSDDTHGNGATGVPEANNGVRVGANTGATGLDRANQTPAAGHVPTVVPAPATPGAPASTGLDTAASTPAGDRVPSVVPPPGPQGTAPGIATANGTPAAGRIPANGPGRP